MRNMNKPLAGLFLLGILIGSPVLAVSVQGQEPDLGGVTEKHQMVPMRDGKRLSVYVYIPEGKGPWPVIFEQRYGSVRGKFPRESSISQFSSFIAKNLNEPKNKPCIVLHRPKNYQRQWRHL